LIARSNPTFCGGLMTLTSGNVFSMASAEPSDEAFVDDDDL
jgi:hypothetical protein